MNKIDPKLLNIISTQSLKKATCIVFANKYNMAKDYIKHFVCDSDIMELPFINAFGIKIKSDNIVKLSKIEDVEYISSTTSVFALMDNATKLLNTQNISISNTQNISVAIIDTGCYPHLDLVLGKNKIIHFVDLINNKTNMYDDNGHGTFVASVLASSGAVSGGKYAGIDKNINIVVIKALDKNGEASALNILNAMQWVYTNKKTYNIKVVCMSFGSTVLGENDPLIKGAESLWNDDVVVVTAGGNSGPDSQTIKAPGASSKIITVGALDTTNEKYIVADFSSRGPILNNYKPDVLAPGVKITSACNYKLTKKFYTQMSGTSVATPMVAGIVSLIIKKYPNISNNQVKKLVLSSCSKLDGDRNSVGYGLVSSNVITNE